MHAAVSKFFMKIYVFVVPIRIGLLWQFLSIPNMQRTDTDQAAHPYSLISVIIIICDFDCFMTYVSISEILIHYLVSAKLSLTQSESRFSSNEAHMIVHFLSTLLALRL